jgi:thiamine pyrophosphate-dependent acetolactate synthase large subunit-like protein
VSTKLDRTDLAKYAKWLDIEYELANEGLDGQIQTAFGRKVPTLIEVRLEDSPSLDMIRRKGTFKTSIKSALGPRAARLLGISNK